MRPHWLQPSDPTGNTVMVTAATTAAAAAAAARVEAERLLCLMLGEGKLDKREEVKVIQRVSHQAGAGLLGGDEGDVVPQEQHQAGAALLGGDKATSVSKRALAAEKLLSGLVVTEKVGHQANTLPQEQHQAGDNIPVNPLKPSSPYTVWLH